MIGIVSALVVLSAVLVVALNVQSTPEVVEEPVEMATCGCGSCNGDCGGNCGAASCSCGNSETCSGGCSGSCGGHCGAKEKTCGCSK